MNRLIPFCLASLITLLPALAPAQEWTTPTPEELSMKSIPEVPGAAAVYLYKEQTTDDGDHVLTFYTRIKVLTEGGKGYANVEIPYSAFNVLAVTGRTIQPDGSIVMLKDKPYDKLIEKSQDRKYHAKVFTLPAVQIGSILEYRYKLELPQYTFYDPTWLLQDELFVRKAHYRWRPTSLSLRKTDGSLTQASVAWTPILPAGVKVVETPLHAGIMSNSNTPTKQLDLDVHDIAPLLHEDFMPPLQSVSYRVLFYYTDVHNEKQFWEEDGKQWSRTIDKFVGPNKGVTAYADSLISPADTQDQKARKLYAAVMQLENTDLTRERGEREDKAEGLKKTTTTDDILARKRGSGDQLAELFVALCRASGLKAYVMGVADRRHRVFLPTYLSLVQIEDYIAIVNIDGKDVYFDPGERYCEVAHLTWKHTLAGGLRQTEKGTEIATTPASSYKANRVVSIANLKLDDRGLATGTVNVTLIGDAALRWRQEALRNDDTALNEALRLDLALSLPGGMTIRVVNVKNLAAAEKPLSIDYEVKGQVGSSTGKRLLLPANLFQVNAHPLFSAEKRETAVDLEYSSYVQEASNYELPAGLSVESSPAAAKASLKTLALYDSSVKISPGSIVGSRSLIIGTPLFYADEYADLRDFYTKVGNHDQETIVLTRTVAAATSAAPQTAANANR